MHKTIFWIFMICSIHNSLIAATERQAREEPMESVMHFNREALSQVSTWLLRNEQGAVLDNYALPEVVIENIDEYIGDEITYSDLLNYFSSRTSLSIKIFVTSCIRRAMSSANAFTARAVAPSSVTITSGCV